jgi:hypothetical protein
LAKVADDGLVIDRAKPHGVKDHIFIPKFGMYALQFLGNIECFNDVSAQPDSLLGKVHRSKHTRPVLTNCMR